MAGELRVEISGSGEMAVVKLIGEARLDIEGAQLQLNRIIAHHPQCVIVDATELSFVSSLGMGMLVSLRRQVAKSGGVVKLVGLQAPVEGALRHARLREIFEIHADMASAMGTGREKKASPEQLDRIGAIAAEMVRPGERVGLGSGKAALAFVRALGARIRGGAVQATGVATSLLTQNVAREAGVPLATLEEVEALDIAVDGADEVDPELNLLKGGGGNLTREKVIASIAKKLVIVVGEEKLVDRLGTTFPVFIEVVEFARPVVIRALKAMGARVEQRMAVDGRVFLTDNGNPYLHAWFDQGAHALDDPAVLDLALHDIPGIIETGLFIGMADQVLIAHCDGRVETRNKTLNPEP